jgi:hypothetical protein
MSEINLIIVPDPEEPEAAEIFVDGSIGGRGYRFLLDTGAARSRLILDDYSARFDSAEKNHSSGVFARASEDLITVPDIRVGPISSQDFSLVRLSRDAGDTRNLIGMDLLKDYRCHFLFNEKRVLVDGNQPESPALSDLLMDRRFHPYVELDFGAIEAKAAWDTGAGITIVDLNFVKKYPALFEEIGESVGTDSTGTQMETPLFIMADTVIGENPFPPLKVAGVDLGAVNASIEIPMDLILGYNALVKADWYFDFPAMKWAIIKFN